MNWTCRAGVRWKPGAPIPLSKAIDYGANRSRSGGSSRPGHCSPRLETGEPLPHKDGRVEILDFGLARLGPSKEASRQEVTVTQKTYSGVVLGTAGFMSPEPVRGKTVDNRTDIFAFGTILYEMVTGKHPFRKPTSAEIMAAIRWTHLKVLLADGTLSHGRTWRPLGQQGTI